MISIESEVQMEVHHVQRHPTSEKVLDGGKLNSPDVGGKHLYATHLRVTAFAN